jgi:hypothetical protein
VGVKDDSGALNRFRSYFVSHFWGWLGGCLGTQYGWEGEEKGRKQSTYPHRLGVSIDRRSAHSREKVSWYHAPAVAGGAGTRHRD